MQVSFKLLGIDKSNLEEIARLVIFKSEILNYHRVSYWRLGQDNMINGVIILKKKWSKKSYPNLSFRYRNEIIVSNVEDYKMHIYKKY